MTTAAATAAVDPITLSVTANFLRTLTEEMGQSLQATAYSCVFSEALDFSCAVFDDTGDLIGQGNFIPSQLAATTFAVKEIQRQFGADGLAPGDIVLHNDPFSGMNHLPEHMVLRGVFLDEKLVGYVACIGHMAEVGGLAAGGFPGDAQEVFHEGLRLPPVRLVKRGELDRDLWAVILANGRTPRVMAGDLRAMMGVLTVGERRLIELVRRHGVARYREIVGAIKDYSERRMRAVISEIPDGTYTASELIIDNDGWVDEPSRVTVAVTVDGDELHVDFAGSDPQCRGACNSTEVATICAAYNALMYLADSEIPVNDGRYRPIRVSAPSGTVVNADFPASTVGGNSEVHPSLVALIWRALADAVPDGLGASGGATWMLASFGGTDRGTGDMYSGLFIEMQGWGGHSRADGWNAVGANNGNCPLTPVEIYESRYPLHHHSYGLDEGSGGAGRYRGGLGTVRVVELTDELTLSCYHSAERMLPWGLRGGGPGTVSSLRVKCPGDDGFSSFKERFGVRCASKFTNVRLVRGTVLELKVGGGGGYGNPAERAPEAIARDLLDGYYDEDAVAGAYPGQVARALELRDRLLEQLRTS
jgi:N-methylhydantoinase B